MAVPYDAAQDWDAAVEIPVRPVADVASAASPVLLAIAAAIATALLVLSTGFRFGVSNNIYHIPLVLDYANLPQFAHDQFYQDLRWIVSLVWPLERLFATETNLHTLFFASYIVALGVLFFALLWIVARFVALGPVGATLAAVLLGLTYLDSGYALLSGENIVGGYFTETQVATALVVVSLALALDRRLIGAIAVLGLAFDAQVEIALWGVAGLAGASVALARDDERIGRAWLIGGMIALVLAAPAAVWWQREIANTGTFPDDYQAYLGLVEPNQWLVWTVPLKKWLLFISAVVLGLSAFTVLGPVSRPACGAFLGFFAVFAIGCVLPFVSSNQWLLNLRPMAADGFLQLLATAAAIAVVLGDVLTGRGIVRVVLSIVIAASLLLSRYLLPIAVVAMLARAALTHGEMLTIERRIHDPNPIAVGRAALVLVLLLAVVGGLLRVRQPLPWTEPEAMRNPGFAAMVDWVRKDTDPRATFLVDGQISGLFNQFQMFTRRAVWMDDRRGASAMWDPRFYEFWKERIDKLWAMDAQVQRLAFSCDAGTDFYADHIGPSLNLDAPAVKPFLAFRDEGFFVIDTKRYCAGR